MSIYVWTEKAARVARDASIAGKPATVCGHTIKSDDALAQAWIDSGYIEQAECRTFGGGERMKTKGVVVVDTKSGTIVKRYATLKDAAARNLYGRDAVRNYCNHRLDESGMCRTFRWAKEADGREGMD